MRIHSDTLTKADLVNALQMGKTDEVFLLHCIEKMSRSRNHAFEVTLRGHGKRHTRRPNNSRHGGGRSDEFMAATYEDWGWWLTFLYQRDPQMRSDYYSNAGDFHKKTNGQFVLEVAS